MIKIKDIRNHIPRLKMGRHHIFAEKLNEFLDQQEKINHIVKRYFELKPDVTGFHITDNFNEKFQEYQDIEKCLKELESELNEIL